MVGLTKEQRAAKEAALAGAEVSAGASSLETAANADNTIRTLTSAEISNSSIAPPAILAAPVLDARARMMQGLAAMAMNEIDRVDNFNELRDANATRFPTGWPKVVNGRKVIGMYLYSGLNGEGLAGNPIVGRVWKPLSREYCATRPELKHITVGFNAEGLYQYEDAIFGYCDEDQWKVYNEAASYNKPNKIQMRAMEEQFKKADDRGHIEQGMRNLPSHDPEAIETADFSNVEVEESVALAMASRGR